MLEELRNFEEAVISGFIWFSKQGSVLGGGELVVKESIPELLVY